jgi:MtN3 and saliva related transmembrane protein
MPTRTFAPQVVKTWRTGGTQLSWVMLVPFGAGVGLWFIYGALRTSLPIMLANGLTRRQVALIAVIRAASAVKEQHST